MEKLFSATTQVIVDSLPSDKRHLVEEIKAGLRVDDAEPKVGTDPRLPGYLIGPLVNVALVKQVEKEWTPDESDVVVASFPKTGTTWTREIVRQILYGEDQHKYDLSKACEFPPLGYVEAVSDAKFEICRSLDMGRMLWGSHLPADLLGLERSLNTSGAKFIYVMRNPKDMLVSLFKFIKAMPFNGHPNIEPYCPREFEPFVHKVVKGESLIPCKMGEWYPHHIRSYYKYKDHPNLLMIKYEDIKQNPSKEISRISNFIGSPLSEARLKEIVEKTSFDSMKKNATVATTKLQMFRKGGVGGWKEHFSDELAKMVDDKFARDMEGVDITFQNQL